LSGPFTNLCFSIFYLSVNQIAKACNDSPIALTQRTSFIQSPNFPNKYQQGQECRWQINLDKGYRVNFTIYDFELDGRRSMRCFDFLAIMDNSEQKEPRNAQGKTIFLDCGVILGRQISSTQGASQANIHFSSHAGTNNRGFLMQYTGKLCFNIHVHVCCPIGYISKNIHVMLQGTRFTKNIHVMLQGTRFTNGNFLM
jgi:hypothetical protein